MKTWQKACSSRSLRSPSAASTCSLSLSSAANPASHLPNQPRAESHARRRRRRAHEVHDLFRRRAQPPGHKRVDEERLHHAVLPPTKADASSSPNRRRHSIRPAPRHQKSHQGCAAGRRSTTASPTALARSSPSSRCPASESLRHGHRRHRRRPGCGTSATSSSTTTIRTPSTTTGPKNVWAAIDAHQVLPGMSELQTRMSIGHNQHSDGSCEGNRTVSYDQAGKQWTVTFVNNHATVIKNQ